MRSRLAAVPAALLDARLETGVRKTHVGVELRPLSLVVALPAAVTLGPIRRCEELDVDVLLPQVGVIAAEEVHLRGTQNLQE